MRAEECLRRQHLWSEQYRYGLGNCAIFRWSAVVESVSGPKRQRIALLVGGPYDGQDIVVSKEQWAQGRLTRNGYRYASKTATPGVGHGSGELPIFNWVDPAR